MGQHLQNTDGFDNVRSRFFYGRKVGQNLPNVDFTMSKAENIMISMAGKWAKLYKMRVYNV